MAAGKHRKIASSGAILQFIQVRERTRSSPNFGSLQLAFANSYYKYPLVKPCLLRLGRIKSLIKLLLTKKRKKRSTLSFSAPIFVPLTDKTSNQISELFYELFRMKSAFVVHSYFLFPGSYFRYVYDFFFLIDFI